jgi:hypothetical protein
VKRKVTVPDGKLPIDEVYRQQGWDSSRNEV